jgi:hypothetical protein
VAGQEEGTNCCPLCRFLQDALHQQLKLFKHKLKAS